jgi:hypothetical protein
MNTPNRKIVGMSLRRVIKRVNDEVNEETYPQLLSDVEAIVDRYLEANKSLMRQRRLEGAAYPISSVGVTRQRHHSAR